MQQLQAAHYISSGKQVQLEAFRSHVFVLVGSNICVSVQITLLYLLRVCQSGPV